MLDEVKDKINLLNTDEMLNKAILEAKTGLKEGGIPIGGSIYDLEGKFISSGRNKRIQENDPSIHGETDAFRNAGRQKSYRNKIMVTTLSPCWYCSGLILQFGFCAVIVGEEKNFVGGTKWLKEKGVLVIDKKSKECTEMLARFIKENPTLWNEDIGVD